MQIYESVGYSYREAVRSIIEHNLYGLDIDDRAYQLAYFAVMMKARQYDRRFLTRKDENERPNIPAPHLYAIDESNGLNRDQLKYFGADLSEFEKNNALLQIEGLLDQLVDAKEYGSILNVDSCDWDLLRRFAKKADDSGQMNMETYGIEETKERLNRMIDIGEVLAQKYDVVCTNPPYMGASGMGSDLAKYVKKNYPDSKSDLFAVFIERCKEMTRKNGYQAMITQHAWMFLSSYEKLRKKLQNINLINMVHLGARAFEKISGEMVQTTSFILQNRSLYEYKGTFCRLIAPTTQKGKEILYLAKENRYVTVQSNFTKIPGSPIAYWVSDKVVENYMHGKVMGEIASPCAGLATGDNNIFQRIWYEVLYDDIGFDVKDCSETLNRKEKWYPCNSGGEYRKWSTDDGIIVNWKKDGSEIRQFRNKSGKLAARPQNTHRYFKEGLTWNKLSTSHFAVKYKREGYIFDDTSRSAFPIERVELFYIIGVLCSCVAAYYLEALNPTMSFTNKDIIRIPVCFCDNSRKQYINECVENNIINSKSDWDAFEVSWDFVQHPLIRFASFSMKEMQKDRKNYIKDAFTNWENECFLRFNRLKANEEELNRIFIDIYGLQEELTPEVDDKDVTVRKADLQRDIRSLIAYAVGCMFGRYSLDTPGLAYAGGEWDSSKYSTFLPDIDNCIPITDKAYFEDDIVNMFEKWLEIVYGADTLEENLDFIANALGNKGSTSREIIRNYFLTEFFKNHCKIYQKRPIYWLFDSGKQNGFKALVYLHRYDENTAGRVLMYLQKLQKKYETEVRAIDTMLDHILDHRHAAAEEKRREHLRKQIEEIKEYNERLEHIANEHIRIDLDDGVKVNYERVQKDREGKRYQILAPIR